MATAFFFRNLTHPYILQILLDPYAHKKHKHTHMNLSLLQPSHHMNHQRTSVCSGQFSPGLVDTCASALPIAIAISTIAATLAYIVFILLLSLSLSLTHSLTLSLMTRVDFTRDPSNSLSFLGLPIFQSIQISKLLF